MKTYRVWGTADGVKLDTSVEASEPYEAIVAACKANVRKCLRFSPLEMGIFVKAFTELRVAPYSKKAGKAKGKKNVKVSPKGSGRKDQD